MEMKYDEQYNKVKRIEAASIYLQYKKQNPNLNDEELRKKLIEAFGEEKTNQIIEDAKNIEKIEGSNYKI